MNTSITTPTTCPYLNDDKSLSEQGKRFIAKVWREKFVFDEYGSISVDDVDDALRADVRGGEWSEDIGSDVLKACLIELGAKPDPEARYHFQARWRDALGAECGPLYAEPVDWLIEDILPRASVGIVVAPSYQLKTWLAMSAAIAVAHDRPWLRNKVAPAESYGPRRVVWVAYEGQTDVERRLRLLGDDGKVYRSAPRLLLDNDAFWTELAKLEPRFVCIDSLARGNPNADEKDSRFAAPLARAANFAREHETTFLFVAHSPKDTGSKDLNDVIRGTSALAAAADTVMYTAALKRATPGADPMERRANVQCLKQKIGGREFDPFMVRLTDARGLELYTEPKQGRSRQTKSQADDDLLFKIVNDNPGIGGGDAIKAASKGKLSRERGKAAQGRLIHSGRIENRGSDQHPKLHKIDGDRRPPSASPSIKSVDPPSTRYMPQVPEDKVNSVAS